MWGQLFVISNKDLTPNVMLVLYLTQFVKPELFFSL